MKNHINSIYQDLIFIIVVPLLLVFEIAEKNSFGITVSIIIGIIYVIDKSHTIKKNKNNDILYYKTASLILVIIINKINIYSDYADIILLITLLINIGLMYIKKSDYRYTKFLKFILLFEYLSILINISKINHIEIIGIMIFSFVIDYKFIENNYGKNKIYIILNIVMLTVSCYMA